MANIKGMVVVLKTKTGSYTGTDNHIYVGLGGKQGGSEFPLDVRGFDDFEAGTVRYWLGDVWDGTALSGARNPYSSSTWNDPEKRYIDLERVDYVYLRKQSYTKDDDKWKMDSVEVTLYGPSPTKRSFHKTGDIWLANEYGLQVYLKEKQVKVG